ncbi:hypothetical protein ACHQM5_011293 [Ranunculus cassubicifolius]
MGRDRSQKRKYSNRLSKRKAYSYVEADLTRKENVGPENMAPDSSEPKWCHRKIQPISKDLLFGLIGDFACLILDDLI